MSQRQPQDARRHTISDDIYCRSFSALRKDPGYYALSQHPSLLHPVVERMAHACGRCDFMLDVVSHGDLVSAIKDALDHSRLVLCDSTMTKAGIISRNLPALSLPQCFLDQIGPADTRTRAAKAVDLWGKHIGQSVAIIGQNPSSLRALCMGLRSGWPMPSAIIAVPVGYVDAAESKEDFISMNLPCAWLSVRGSFGGSALAAAAFNACSQIQPAVQTPFT